VKAKSLNSNDGSPNVLPSEKEPTGKRKRVDMENNEAASTTASKDDADDSERISDKGDNKKAKTILSTKTANKLSAFGFGKH